MSEVSMYDVQVTSALEVLRSSRATLLLTSLKMLWSTQDLADTCSFYTEDRCVKKCKLSKLTKTRLYVFFLNFPFVQVLGPMRVQLLHPVSRFKRVQSLQHLCRYIIVKHVRWVGLVAIKLHWIKRMAFGDVSEYAPSHDNCCAFAQS